MISELKDCYSGRIFLIGSGPSIKETPLELLQDEYTFAANSIPDIFSETDWRPSFYACVDDRVDIRYCQEAIDLGIPCFFNNKTSQKQILNEYNSNFDNVLFFNSEDIRNKDELDITTYQLNLDSIKNYQNVWSEDITEVVYGYNTVMYHMMQISYYMGFDEIYLVGNDLFDVFDPYPIFPEADDPATYPVQHDSTILNAIEFIRDSGYQWKSLCNAFVYRILKSNNFSTLLSYISGFIPDFDQNNYFSEDYSTGEIITYEKNQRHILAHQLARSVSDELGFDIYNATIGGYLEVYPRVEITDIVETNS